LVAHPCLSVQHCRTFRARKKIIVVSHLIFLLRQANEGFFFFFIFFLFFRFSYFQKRRGPFIRVMYFNHVLKCPVDLKTKFGTGFLSNWHPECFPD
jgi:hypothetical protein